MLRCTLEMIRFCKFVDSHISTEFFFMKQSVYLIFFLLVLATGCTDKSISQNERKEAIQEISEAEKKFAGLCIKKGVEKAFAFYADDSARIRSADSLISGKKAIQKYYAQPFFKKVTLQWSPDFVDAAASGDIGYTFGRYTLIITDRKGKKNITKGIFHTVWKKKNGAWKFVWDS